MKMEAVTIYDSNVNIISYSTDEEKIGKKIWEGLNMKILDWTGKFPDNFQRQYIESFS